MDVRHRLHSSHNPALDGLRGLCVAAVLLFHQGFAWAKGGYLGVSTFFTLSGFLITRLLLAERTATGRIELTSFWARRLRRLLPAAAATLGLLAISALVTQEVWERTLGHDVIAAALNVANWRFLLSEQSYAALFSARSPVLHFWSLAIEEQFYLLFPLLTVGVLRLGRGSLRIFGAVLGALVAVSLGLTLVFSGNHDAVYYATPIRMGEILVGAFLAIAFTRAPAVLGVVGLGGLLAAWTLVDQHNEALYRGGLLAYALVSGIVLLSAEARGPIRWLLSTEPLRLLGLVSYGVYLIHWPVFLLLDEARTGMRGWNLFAVRGAITLALAAASYRWLEQPIRQGLRPKALRPSWLAGGAVASVATTAVVVPLVAPPPADPFEQAQQALQGNTRTLPDPATLAPDAKIAVTLGDSTGTMTFSGLQAWGDANHRLVVAGGAGGMACGLGRKGVVNYADDFFRPLDDRPECANWPDDLMSAADQAEARYGHVDLAIIQHGPWEIVDRQLEGHDEFRHIGDPQIDRQIWTDMVTATDPLLNRGVTVVWLTAPYLHTGFRDAVPERMDRYNAMVRKLDELRQGVVAVDLAGWIEGLPPGEDERLRPDGTHFSTKSPMAVEAAERWLGNAILEASAQESP